MKTGVVTTKSVLQQLFILVLCVTVCLCFVYWWLTNLQNHIFKRPGKMENEIIKLLWWNTTSPVTNWNECTATCGCTFSNNQTRLRSANAVMFVLDEVVSWQMPLPRAPHHIWALVTARSPLANLHFIHPELLQHFNFTATYSQYSNYPLTTAYLPQLELLYDVFNAKPVAVKSQLRKRLAPVLFMESDCDTMSARTEYARELMQYIEVDSYGSCLNNRHANPKLVSDFRHRFYSVALARFISEYKFILSIEDISCHDFISSLYWKPLCLGVVPIYFGAPNIRSWEPTKQSAVYISEYPNAKALAEYLKELDSNDDLYMEYLAHQSKSLVQNRRLIERRTQTYMDTKFPRDLIIGCEVCDWSCNALFQWPNIGKRPPTRPLCPLQPERAPLMSAPNESLIWETKLELSRHQAIALDELIRLNKPYTKEEYEQRVAKQIALAEQNTADKNQPSVVLQESLLYE